MTNGSMSNQLKPMKRASNRRRQLAGAQAQTGLTSLAWWPSGATRAAALAAGLALAACASSSTTPPAQHATAQDLLALNNMTEATGARRDLTPAEKDVISHAVGLSISNPGSAQFRWPQISGTEEGSVNYCGMVNAKSPFPAYNGWQAYIVEATVSGGHISSAVVGLIAGGKDTDIVRKMCTKYGLDPGAAGGPG